jgi:hypothetical protein
MAVDDGRVFPRARAARYVPEALGMQRILRSQCPAWFPAMRSSGRLHALLTL